MASSAFLSLISPLAGGITTAADLAMSRGWGRDTRLPTREVLVKLPGKVPEQERWVGQAWPRVSPAECIMFVDVYHKLEYN